MTIPIIATEARAAAARSGDAIISNIRRGQICHLQPEAVSQPAAGNLPAAALQQSTPKRVYFGLIVAGQKHRDGIVERIVRAGRHRNDRTPRQREFHDPDRSRRA